MHTLLYMEATVELRHESSESKSRALPPREREHELRLRVALAMAQKVAPGEAVKLLQRFGSLSGAFGASHGELETLQRGMSQKLAITAGRVKNGEVDDQIAETERAGARLLLLEDGEFPELLRHIPDPPLLLWIRGRLTEEDRLSIGIVGSRNSDYYGAKTSHGLAADLAQLGVTVVSGLARGIDTAAHRGALEARGRTVAVVGSGLVELYPPENRRLAEEIAESGAVLSEFPLKTPGIPRNFPQRNRILSGLSLGVVVVQAGMRSGSLITAKFANSQGREVFAVPGKVDCDDHRGCHWLIREGAKLTEGVEDIVNEIPALEMFSEEFRQQAALNPEPMLFAPVPVGSQSGDGDSGVDDSESPAAKGPQSERSADKRASPKKGKHRASRAKVAIGQSPLEVAILKALKPSDGVNVEELVANLGVAPHEAASTLMSLEMRGLVRQLPGRNYVLG